MKFAKELERDAVPEWRIKYLNYKAGKKHIKAVARAIVRTPRAISHHRTTTPSSFPFPRAGDDHRPSQARRSASLPRSSPRRRRSSDSHAPSRRSQSLATLADDDGRLAEHGNAPELADDPEEGEFELPAPAIRSPPDPPKPSRPPDALRRSFSRFATLTRASNASTPRPKTLSRRPTAGAAFSESPSHLRRIWTQASHQLAREHSRPDGAPLQQQLDVVRERERLFYQFLDAELEKVETFYKMKEQQAGQRLSILREQLHEMRSRRVQEIAHATDNQHGHDDDNDDVNDGRRQHAFHNGGDAENGHGKPNGWVQPIRAKMFPPGPNSKALRTMPETPHLPPSASAETRRDYSRRPEDQDVSYRTAKRKLKLALAELYRALELLKSYALLNRTAFRKLNKKYDKATNARVPLRYMHEKVNSAWFVNSDVLEGHIKAVEDLYARYFERGNHKLAAGKLRGLSRKSTDESGSSFLNGFLIGTGLVFCIQGLAYGSQLLFDPDAQLRAQTSYLMQLYAGYFLMLLLFALFCIDCFVWTKSKVNYPFIFEFDQRSHVDWRRLAEFPSFFLLLLGIFMWMNFSRYGAPGMYLYYPVILVGITILIIFFPAPVLAYKSRKWFVYAHWRLLLAGIYPVEFRDFFLGDMYCSLTYSMANVELFFCLYANQWRNPTQCNSSNSRVLGFLLTLPPIWRFLQCLRRYRDTRNVFPHLINAGKYVMTIVTYVVLSLYRINGSHTNLALFITFALVNSIYTCTVGGRTT
ncbi:hypothetical protein CDD83_547 [Cordyceps sp. RAO-2017]|nr:hypothetical protein CDD83_547 [Cordyceps sp. RAO-2017]